MLFIIWLYAPCYAPTSGVTWSESAEVLILTDPERLNASERLCFCHINGQVQCFLLLLFIFMIIVHRNFTGIPLSFLPLCVFFSPEVAGWLRCVDLMRISVKISCFFFQIVVVLLLYALYLGFRCDIQHNTVYSTLSNPVWELSCDCHLVKPLGLFLLRLDQCFMLLY